MGLFCKSRRRGTTNFSYSYTRQGNIREPNVDATAAAAARVSYRRSRFSPSPGVRVSATARAERRGQRGDASRYRAGGLAETYDGPGSGPSYSSTSHTRPPRRRREQKFYATSGIDDRCGGCDDCFLPERGFDQEAGCCDGCCSPSFSSPAPCGCDYCYSGHRVDGCPDCEQASHRDRLGSRLDRCCGAGVGCSMGGPPYETGLDWVDGCDCPAC